MKPTEHTFTAKSSTLSWLPVIACMMLAAYIRYWTNSDLNYLLLGGDGPYYPLQIRSMMEEQRLAFPDLPLLFILEGMFAKLLCWFHAGSCNQTIITVAKLADAVLPPLAAIPVFLISKELTSGRKRAWLLNYAMVAFSVINFTTTVPFSGGLHKNAVAVVWMFLFFLIMLRFIIYRQRKHLYWLLLVLTLCALTHFGCFTILLFFSGLTAFFQALYHRDAMKRIRPKQLLLVLSTLTVSLAIIGFADPERFSRLVHIPLKLFEFPVFLMILNSYDISLFLSPVNMVTMIPLALTGMLLLVIHRKHIDRDKKALGWTLSLGALLLANPLIGLEWANRLHLMAYVPITVLYLLLFNVLSSKLAKAFPVMIFGMIMAASLLNIRQNKGCISDESYEEFVQIKDHVPFTQHSVIIGRQDLRILASWEFRTQAAVEYLFTKNDFKNYDAVYVIRQLQGSNFPPGRFRGDARVPDNATKVYSGPCFELYRLNSSKDWQGGKGKPSKAHGIVLAQTPDYLILQNDQGFKRTVELTEHTVFETPIKVGSSVEVWGSWKPFSLNVVAGSVRELKE